MRENEIGSLLVAYYEGLLRDRDIDGFRQQVSARYTEGTLCRLLESTDRESRRAAVLALGLFGGFESNAVVARALRDGDAIVRNLAVDALWSIWFRGDAEANNRELKRLMQLRDLEQATAGLDALIKKAPTFAEAYNQRAVFHFRRGDFAPHRAA